MTESILIADDHALFRAGLRELVLQVFKDVLVLEADCYDLALEIVQKTTDCSMALVDLRMPGMEGFSTLAQLVHAGPGIPFVVFSASTDPTDIRQCFDCGVMGYVPKNESSSVMARALELVLSGGIYIPPDMMKQHIEHPQKAASLIEQLTDRQREVLECMAKGLSNKEIARNLFLSEATVKAHITAIFKGLNVSSRTQAVIYSNSMEP